VRPKGVEIVTVCLEITGAETARPYIEAAHPEHPSLIDVGHEMDAKFGVVNIPNGVWIDEDGVIVRPAEPASSGAPVATRQTRPPDPNDPRMAKIGELVSTRISVDRDRYSAAIRDWAEKGAASEFALSRDEVIARSHPRPKPVAEAAAHFELAQHLWHAGQREGAIAQFRQAHRLQPDNWTYKRQAWSLVSAEAAGADDGAMARFQQWPKLGHEDEWPFESDWLRDVEKLGPGQYYPQSL